MKRSSPPSTEQAITFSGPCPQLATAACPDAFERTQTTAAPVRPGGGVTTVKPGAGMIASALLMKQTTSLAKGPPPIPIAVVVQMKATWFGSPGPFGTQTICLLK